MYYIKPVIVLHLISCSVQFLPYKVNIVAYFLSNDS